VYRNTHTNAKSSFETLRSFTGDGYGSYLIITFLFVLNDDDSNIIKVTITVTLPTTAMSLYKEKFLTWRRCKSLRL